MGSYKEVKGDLLALAKEGHFDVICHGANCRSVIGAGIAGQIAKQFPAAYRIDGEDPRKNPYQKYGDLSYYLDIEYDVYIVNLYTQLNPGPEFNIIALESALWKFKLMFAEEQKVGLPMIGAGIGGGNWEEIKVVIQRVLSDYDVTVVIYDK